MNKTLVIAAALFISLSTTAITTRAEARDQIRIVGSSTVYPFSTTVAEQFGQKNKAKFKTPIVESTGTGGGIKLFCEGLGDNTPDIANASRRIKPDELVTCYKNKVTDIQEVKVGYDGIVIANAVSAPKYDLTAQQLFLALGKQVPDAKDSKKLVPNYYKTWNQIDPKLPNKAISVYGPPPSSGTRDSFAELVMESGCWNLTAYTAAYANPDERKKACHVMREDGAYVEAGENDNLIVQKLSKNVDSLGIFGYSFAEENPNLVQPAKIAGIAPSVETISNGKYPVSRPLFMYVKSGHIGKVPGIQEFLTEFVSEDAAGGFGYLADKGIVPLIPAVLATTQADVKAGKKLQNLAE